MTVAVVDDDHDVRKTLGRLGRSMRHAVQSFASAEDFEPRVTAVDCAVVDVHLPGASGLELCDRLRGKAAPAPVVLSSGDPDPTATDPVRAMDTPSRSKPFDYLLAAITDTMSVEPGVSDSHA